MLSIFLDIKKIDFWWKNADVSKYHGVCHAIYFFFGSSLERQILGRGAFLAPLNP